MKNRFLCLCLAGVLLGLASCAPAPAYTPSPSPSPEAEASPAPTPEPFAVQAADVPPGDYEPWQEGYAAFLTELRQQEGELRNWVRNATGEELDEASERANASADVSESYCLYDVDKDGIPELFVKYGDCEADYYSVCYTFRDGLVVAIGDFPSGYSSLYTWPGENAVIYSWGHMGTSEMEKLSIQDGQLVFTEDFYQETEWNEESLDYTDPALFLPGSEYIPSFYTGNLWRPPETPAQLLPIYDYGALPRENPAPMEESEVRSAIGRVLWEGTELAGVSGDGFHGDTGLVTLEKYLHPDLDYRYTEEPISVTRYAWADANGDGQTDCILCLMDPERNLDAYVYVVLNCQDGQVYGYFFDFMKNAAVDPDGTIYFQQFEEWRQVSFYKNQCYDFPAQQAPVEECDLPWEKFN